MNVRALIGFSDRKALTHHVEITMLIRLAVAVPTLQCLVPVKRCHSIELSDAGVCGGVTAVVRVGAHCTTHATYQREHVLADGVVSCDHLLLDLLHTEVAADMFRDVEALELHFLPRNYLDFLHTHLRHLTLGYERVSSDTRLADALARVSELEELVLCPASFTDGHLWVQLLCAWLSSGERPRVLQELIVVLGEGALTFEMRQFPTLFHAADCLRNLQLVFTDAQRHQEFAVDAHRTMAAHFPRTEGVEWECGDDRYYWNPYQCRTIHLSVHCVV